MTQIRDLQKFWDDCVAYWMRGGCEKAEAEGRALYWDFVECFDFDHSWTDEKRKFVEERKATVKPPHGID